VGEAAPWGYLGQAGWLGYEIEERGWTALEVWAKMAQGLEKGLNSC
jgi:hypothetical protein